MGQRRPRHPAAKLPDVDAPAGQFRVQRVDRQHVLLFLGAAQQHRAQRPGRRGPGDDVEQGREQAAGQHVLGGAVPDGVRRAGADIAQRRDGELLPARGHAVPGEGVT